MNLVFIMTRARVAALAWLTAWAALTAPIPVEAQRSGENAVEVAAARDAFRSGIRHAQAGRWSEARDAFARSFQLSNRPISLLNLAGAQAQTGQLIDAAESYRRFLRMQGRSVERRRAVATEALAALEPRIPTAMFHVTGLAPDDVVVLDGEPVEPAILEGAAPLDPGAHRLEVRRDDQVIAERAFELEEGTREAIELVVTAPPPPEPEPAVELAPTAMTAPVEEASSGPEFYEEPVFWIVLIGVLALGGVAAGIAIDFAQGPIPSDAPGSRLAL